MTERSVDSWQQLARDWKRLYLATMNALEQALARHNDLHDRYLNAVRAARTAEIVADTYRRRIDELTRDTPDA